MTNRFNSHTLRLLNLSNLSQIGSDYTNAVISASGTERIRQVGNGSFSFSAHNSTVYSAVTSNIGQVAYIFMRDEVAGGIVYVAAFVMQKVHLSTDTGGAIITVSGPGS